MSRARVLADYVAGGTTAAEFDYLDGVTSNIQTQLAARLPLAGGAMTGAITTNSTFDGVDIATRDGVLSSTTTTAGAALPKAGGAMTGAITTNSTFDGIDIATRDAVLTSTTTTANAALPKAGGTMTGNIVMGDDTSIGIADDAERIEFDGAGDISLLGCSVGIGTTTPSDIKMLDIQDPTTRNVATIGDAPGMKLTSRLDTVGERLEINFESYISQTYGTASIGIVHDSTSAYETSALFFATKSGTGGSDRPIERLRITSSGKVGIGNTAPRGSFDVLSGEANIDGGAIDVGLFTGVTRAITDHVALLQLQSNSDKNADIGATLGFGGRTTTNTTADMLAVIKGAKENAVDGDKDGYLAFGTRENSAGITESMRIDSDGNVGIGTDDPSGIGHFYLSPQCWVYIQGTGTGNDHSGINILTDSGTWTWGAAHSGSSAIGANMLYAYRGGKQLQLDTSGNLSVNGSSTLGTFDFAEYFEWLDGNSDEENRTGISVVLEGDKIKPAEEGDTPIGIISATAAFIGNAAPMRWHGKYKCNDLGEFTLDTDGERVVSDDYVENILKGTEEDVHPTVIYENRESRQEWDVVGLLGQIALKKGQPVADSWIKMKDVSETVELWFVK